MPARVFLVRGDSGDSQDNYFEWVVVAYTEREQAELHAERARAWLREHNLDLEWRPDRVEELAGNPYDPDMDLGASTAPSYDVFERTLYRHLDEYLES